MDEKKNLSQLLHEMSRVELEDVVIRAKVLLDMDKTALYDDIENPDEEMFYEALCDGFPGKKHTFKSFRKRHNYKTFHENFEEVTYYVDANFGYIDHDDKLKIYMIMSHVLRDYMEKLKMDLTMKSLSHQIKKISFLMERYFPGYSESGVLSLIIGLPPRV